MSENNNLNTLKEMILDEQKLVTYVTLSRELCLHVNESKLLLGKVIEEIRNKEPATRLNVCYIISGLTADNSARTSVVTENEVSELKKAFKITFFEHIYSVNKGLCAVDNVSLLSASKFDDLPLCAGLIKSSICIKRTSDEIDKITSNNETSISEPQEKANVSHKKSKESKDIVKNTHDLKPVTKIIETKSEPPIKTEIPSPKKTQNTSNNSNQKSDNKKNGKSQKGIAGFFNRSNSAPNNKATKSAVQGEEVVVKAEKETEKEVKLEKMEIDKEVPAKKEVDKEIAFNKEVDKTITKIKNEKGISNTKSLNQIKKNSKVDKKRKRVLHVSDSESEDDPFADNIEVAEKTVSHESEDEIPLTPSVNTIKITSGIVNPRKRRKMVDKTYTDEEGYILTKKVEVYESCSENEEEQPAKENVQVQIKKPVQNGSPKKQNGTNNNKKKISPPQKGKQPTMMNFFKKK